jgi:dienelactone hydrolase
VIVATLGAACGGQKQAVRTTPSAQPRDFSNRGPYSVGVAEVHLDAAHPALIFYPVDRGAVPANARQYGYSPQEVWGSLAAAFPKGSLQTTSVDDAWVGVPASARGPFPVVVHSHGRGSDYRFESRHCAHIASWGYVVIAPRHPERDLLQTLTASAKGPTASDEKTVFAAVSRLGAEKTRADGSLKGVIDPSRVAVEGHAAGGRTAGVAAYSPEVDAWIGIGPAPPVPDAAARGRDVVRDGNGGYDPAQGEFDLRAFLAAHEPPRKPSMTITTDSELWYPIADVRQVWDWLPAPKRFVVLAHTGFNVFEDYCALAQSRGGMQAVIDAFKLQGDALADVRGSEEGCLRKYAPVEDVTAVWNHLTVAQLDAFFGIDVDVANASLERAYLDATFPGAISEYLVEP